MPFCRVGSGYSFTCPRLQYPVGGAIPIKMSQPRVTPAMLAVVASPAPITMNDLFGGQPSVDLNPSEALRGLLPADCREYFLVFAPCGRVWAVGVAGGDGYLDAWGVEINPTTGLVRGRDHLLAESGEGQVVQHWDRLPVPQAQGAWVSPQVSFAARKAAADHAAAKAKVKAERVKAAKAKAKAEAERRSHLQEVGREARKGRLSGKAAKIPGKVAAKLAAAKGGKRK